MNPSKEILDIASQFNTRHRWDTDQSLALAREVLTDCNAHDIVRLIDNGSELRLTLSQLAEKVRRANGIQHSGGVITPDDWSDLYDVTNDAFALLAKVEGTHK